MNQNPTQVFPESVHDQNQEPEIHDWWTFFDGIDKQLADYLRYGLKCCLLSTYFLIGVIGIMGNAIVISGAILRPQFRTATGVFLLNKAIGDFLYFLAAIFADGYAPWINSFIRNILIFIINVSVSVSVWSIVALVMNSTAKLTTIHNGLTRSQAVKFAIFVWVKALTVHITNGTLFEEVVWGDNYLFTVEYCIQSETLNIHIRYIASVLFVYIALILEI